MKRIAVDFFKLEKNGAISEFYSYGILAGPIKQLGPSHYVASMVFHRFDAPLPTQAFFVSQKSADDAIDMAIDKLKALKQLQNFKLAKLPF